MKINVSEKNSVMIVSPVADILDHIVVSDLKVVLMEVIEKDRKNVVLNLIDIKHIRSAGIGLIISALKTFKSKGGDLKLCNLNEEGQELFELCKLNEHIGIFGSEKEAIKRFAVNG